MGELAELFQWRVDPVPRGLIGFTSEDKRRVGEEMSDVRCTDSFCPFHIICAEHALCHVCRFAIHTCIERMYCGPWVVLHSHCLLNLLVHTMLLFNHAVPLADNAELHCVHTPLAIGCNGICISPQLTTIAAGSQTLVHCMLLCRYCYT